MGKEFVIICSDVASKIEEAKRAAANNGATMRGNTSRGSFSVKGVEGTYTVNGNKITINITDKPFFISWGIVEDKIRSFFS